MDSGMNSVGQTVSFPLPKIEITQSHHTLHYNSTLFQKKKKEIFVYILI